ncbi:MAG: hypothetical protein ABMA64_09050 [Myxococcota bacterium]
MWLWLATEARADRYWDLEPAVAEALAARLTPGAVVVTWCEPCGGDLRVLAVRSARVAPGTYDEARRSVVLERDVLFVGTSPSAPVIAADARCGARREDWIDPVAADGPAITEHLDVPYSFLIEWGGLTWLGPEGSAPEAAPALDPRSSKSITKCARKAPPLPPA